MKIPVDEVLRKIDQILAAAKTDCIQSLKTIVKTQPQKDQIYGCLELFHMQNYELVYNAFFARNGKLDVDYACLPNFEGNKSFIPALNEYFKSIIEKVGWGQAEGEEFTLKHEAQFLEWFKECWTAAEGSQSKVPTFFCFEKEYRVQDIMTGKVMEEDEAARMLGFNVSN